MSNTENFEANWNKMKSKLKEKWEKLTESDITQINGKREHLLAKLEERYSWDKKGAEEELKKFESSCGCSSCDSSDPKRKVG
jgi:uncharacterized protein YjbJ (UPF0337 family)